MKKAIAKRLTLFVDTHTLYWEQDFYRANFWAEKPIETRTQLVWLMELLSEVNDIEPIEIPADVHAIDTCPMPNHYKERVICLPTKAAPHDERSLPIRHFLIYEYWTHFHLSWWWLVTVQWEVASWREIKTSIVKKKPNSFMSMYFGQCNFAMTVASESSVLVSRTLNILVTFKPLVSLLIRGGICLANCKDYKGYNRKEVQLVDFAKVPVGSLRLKVV